MKVLGLLIGGLLLAGCAHRDPYQPKVRTFDPGKYGAEARTASAAPGAIGAIGMHGLIEDDRPGEVGDVLTIRIDEADSASHDSSTKLNRKSAQNFGLSAALDKSGASSDLKAMAGATTDSSFAGAGQVQRHGRLNAVLPVRIRRRLPNGDLYVEGTKVVLIGEEERHLYLSGVVRPVDIAADGSVPSSRIADAEIEYTGRGDATDQQRPGWFSRLLTSIWPF